MTRNLDDYVKLINEKLFDFLPEKDIIQNSIVNAMEYSLLAGGKRLRPVLTMSFCEACGGNIETAIPFACAVEMIHTYSLIHDDLPCLDNDFLRRGRPSNHVANGEAMALLAGDALLTRAFEIMLSAETIKLVGADVVLKAADCLAKNSGVYGMIGGQVIDLLSGGKNLNQIELDKMHSLKTGALISAAAQIGCIVANADKEKIIAAQNYAQLIGLAFQIVDDILDVEGNQEIVGKTLKKDKNQNKLTFVGCYGVDASRMMAKELVSEAKDLISAFGDKSSDLQNLADFIVERTY